MHTINNTQTHKFFTQVFIKGNRPKKLKLKIIVSQECSNVLSPFKKYFVSYKVL